MDETFEMEQRHLSETYATLERLRDGLYEELEVKQKAAAADLKDMSEEVRPDFVGPDETLETLAAIETLNAVIDAYNQNHDFTLDKYRRVLVLLAQPYFAKVRLQMRPGKPARDLYIGAVGVNDERRNPVVVDWRSPVASTYYNQEMGPTSFYVDGKRRDVVLELRRQFDIVRDELRSYFDTTVAIQDSLLLQVLKHSRSERLQAITATIQREQNEVIRHADVPVLLVNGIAGSGKTSVMLQRIAYLFYEQRETLSPDQIHLLTPNDVFGSYISAVLPSLGEANPKIMTWDGLMAEQGLAGRASGADTPHESLVRMEQAASAPGGLELSLDDFRAIVVDGIPLIKQSQAKASWDRFAKAKAGHRRAALARQDLHDKLDRRIARMARDSDMQEQMLSLDLDDQVRVFGGPITADTEDEAASLCRTYLAWRMGDAAHAAIEADEWLRIDRIGMRMLGTDSLSAAEWLWCRLVVAGGADRDARYVMVDEVQDYTLAQLEVLARLFPSAHFLLLGDENQAIREGTASFAELRELFGRTHGQVEECRLLTSYRSSPEITRLFLGVVGGVDGARPTSVRDEGTPVERHECASEQDYLSTLRALAREAAEAGAATASGAAGQPGSAQGPSPSAEDGLTAFVVADDARARWIAKQLGDDARLLHAGDDLPATGAVVVPLRLAKGLEFSHVVVADAQADACPDTLLTRRRLYTAISRAMHKVTLVSEGPMAAFL
ncbi:MAG: AAA family ATPase [Atopobiaceae bacterium]|jgi:DNA helicase-2/ATP-dependent DNA helicase PcrA|nr:AAA family ATPase [Atopobiaceae bacterium]MCI1319030.1 AAA family ATPase [Atopobiaceae bacterium]MCI1389751.1 AAA family ATPase [Atopobiaceae bacterium]MCI1432711.1 AAA family ATPase [Atopobiaceae bacterium]MCI1470952.1 AAA family ATPase [Atopobiaceae bacterium]